MNYSLIGCATSKRHALPRRCTQRCRAPDTSCRSALTHLCHRCELWCNSHKFSLRRLLGKCFGHKCKFGTKHAEEEGENEAHINQNISSCWAVSTTKYPGLSASSTRRLFCFDCHFQHLFHIVLILRTSHEFIESQYFSWAGTAVEPLARKPIYPLNTYHINSRAGNWH